MAIQFKVGARVFKAPLPMMGLEDNVRELAKTYPQFRWTRVLESDAQVIEDGTLQYELVLPPVKVNG